VPKPLSILLVEDSIADAELILRQLRRSELKISCERVCTAEEMQTAMGQRGWDVVISDYRLPGFSAVGALDILKQHALDIPFIVVSGAIGEEEAVGLMKAGAHDFISKQNLVRLVPALERELRESQHRHKYRIAQEALWNSEQRLRAIMDNAPLIVFAKDLEGRHLFVNRQFEALYGMKREQVIGKTDEELFPPEVARRFREYDRRVIESNDLLKSEDSWNGKDASRSYLVIKFPLRDASGAPYAVCCIATEMTEQRTQAKAIQRANERLHRLSKRLLEVQEAERRHIACELHDEIGQALTATKINLQAMQRFPDPVTLPQKVQDCVVMVDRLLQQVRNISLNLRPPLLDDLGLVPAIRWYLDQQGKRSGLVVQFDPDPKIERVRAALEIACFRVVQEAVTNVIRHARASSLKVSLQINEDRLHLRIRDDGIGFNAESSQARAEAGGSFGLLGMQERATLSGGKIEFHSVLGEGTEIHAQFPFHAEIATGDKT
jgi:two-component system, NarL family, sensor histidine kinase UhpB